MKFKLVEIQPDGLILENEHSVKFKVTLDWFAENFIIIQNLKAKEFILDCGYKPTTNNNRL